MKDGKQDRRPAALKARRRSTLHWASATPRVRQEKLEGVAERHVANTWFSLHSVGTDKGEPFYVSEVMEQNMNPSFRFFDLNSCEPRVRRQDQFKLRIWAKTDQMEDYVHLVELDVSLRSLQFVTKALEQFHHPFVANSVLFHLSDGIYTSFTDLPGEEQNLLHPPSSSRASSAVSTSSFEALMQLANLDDCIQDAMSTRRDIESQINTVLQKRDNQPSENISKVFRTTNIDMAVATEQKNVRNLKKRLNELRASLASRRAKISDTKMSKSTSELKADSLRQAFKDTVMAQGQTSSQSTGQLRRICEDLQTVFPIEPLRNKALQFSIRGIYLPNSTFDDTNRDEIAAALGMVARLVALLSSYLSVPLPYPIQTTKGDPTITDPISIGLTQRQFPLHPTSVAYKFEYGVFLLNKDIEFLMNKPGIRMLDIRHTLPNLKYLLYVLTAGRGELPARKAGGVRGLLGARITPTASRRSSQDSVLSTSGFSFKGKGEMRIGNGTVRALPREKELDSNDTFVTSSYSSLQSARKNLMSRPPDT